VTSTAVRGLARELLRRIDEIVAVAPKQPGESTWHRRARRTFARRSGEADRVIQGAISEAKRPDTVTGRVDAV